MAVFSEGHKEVEGLLQQGYHGEILVPKIHFAKINVFGPEIKVNTEIINESNKELQAVKYSNIRKRKYSPATTTAAPTAVYITLRVPPKDFETGWTGELWLNTKLLKWQN